MKFNMYITNITTEILKQNTIYRIELYCYLIVI